VGDPEARDASRTTIAFWQMAVGLCALSLWQGLVALKLLDPFFVSRPTAIAQRIAIWVIDGSLWRHLAATLEESLLGLVLGAAAGISLGFLLGRSPVLARVFDPYIKMLNASCSHRCFCCGSGSGSGRRSRWR